jgi:hypothetical protein
VDRLAKNTRGLIEDDIYKSVDEYIELDKVPQALQHPTNTCDPITGNWTEHLMNPYNLAVVLEKTGVKTKVLNGYYGHSERKRSRTKLSLGRVLNIAINILGKQGIRIAPFYTLLGEKS